MTRLYNTSQRSKIKEGNHRVEALMSLSWLASLSKPNSFLWSQAWSWCSDHLGHLTQQNYILFLMDKGHQNIHTFTYVHNCLVGLQEMRQIWWSKTKELFSNAVQNFSKLPSSVLWSSGEAPTVAVAYLGGQPSPPLGYTGAFWAPERRQTHRKKKSDYHCKRRPEKRVSETL